MKTQFESLVIAFWSRSTKLPELKHTTHTTPSMYLNNIMALYIGQDVLSFETLK